MNDPTRGPERIWVNEPLLRINMETAQQNRQLFQSHGVTVLNVMSSPGSGKTELIGQTLYRLRAVIRACVIVGDLATDNDANRLRNLEIDARQIETGTQCHLDAEMIRRQAVEMPLCNIDLLIIENVGNLVCPANYDLGETCRVVLMSVTEGEDKPLKYPSIYRTADAVIINKMDLATAAGFDRELAEYNTRLAAPRAAIFELSARSGEGMQAWVLWLRDLIAKNTIRKTGPVEV